jgi:hypothetical protein
MLYEVLGQSLSDCGKPRIHGSLDVHDLAKINRTWQMADQLTARLVRLLRLLFLVLEAIVVVRIAFKALGANAEAAFASFVYAISDPLVAPFHPIFHDQDVSGHPLEVGSLIAIAFYLVAVYLIVRILRILLRGG